MFLLRLLPEETQRRLLAARKERLLAVRSALDHWIEKVEERRRALHEEGQKDDEAEGVDVEAARREARE